MIDGFSPPRIRSDPRCACTQAGSADLFRLQSPPELGRRSSGLEHAMFSGSAADHIPYYTKLSHGITESRLQFFYVSLNNV